MKHELQVIVILCGALFIEMIAGCAALETSLPAERVGQPVVAQIGAMRKVMREGHTESRLILRDAVALPHAFAVGALEGLDGEIMIVDGDVWVARTNDGKLYVTGPTPVAEDQATLLTLTHVDSWQSVSIETAASGLELEAMIERSARRQGIDTSVPFPFQLRGKVTSIDIHVINGYCPVGTDPATMDAQPWRESESTNTDVVIVGFYAPEAAGVMTHHGTSIHAHALMTVKGQVLTGHVERVMVMPGMILQLPKSEEN